MKIAKKLSSVIIALVVCAMLAATAWATVTYVSYTGELDQSSISTSADSQTVTLTVKASKDVTMDAFQAEVMVPDGWSIQSISSDNQGTLIVEGGAMIWYATYAEDVTADLLATVEVVVPENVDPGEYEIGFQIIEMSRQYGSSWDSGNPITATLTVNGCDHTETETTTTYENNGDNHTVTVTCECGEKISSETEPHADAVNDGNHECDKCNAVVEECADDPTDGDHTCDECGAENVTDCSDASTDGDHTCDECGAENITDCSDADNDGDHNCDDCNAENVTVCVNAPEPVDHICDTDSACDKYWANHVDGDDDDFDCDYCGGAIVCDQCEPQLVTGKAATCKESGWMDYYQCTACGKYYSTNEASDETAIADIEAWQAEGGAGYVPVDGTNHVGVQTTTYTNNGDNHTQTVTCDCGGVVSTTVEDHTYGADGKCICTAEKPATPVTNVSVIDKTKGTADYTVDGSVVTVTHSIACKVGFWSESEGKYVALTATKVSDNTYSFTAPEGVTEVLLVVKGDANADGKVTTPDKTQVNAAALRKLTLNAEATFAADVSGDGKVTTPDKTQVNAAALRKLTFTW